MISNQPHQKLFVRPLLLACKTDLASRMNWQSGQRRAVHFFRHSCGDSLHRTSPPPTFELIHFRWIHFRVGKRRPTDSAANEMARLFFIKRKYLFKSLGLMLFHEMMSNISLLALKPRCHAGICRCHR